jgi:hypothetical protein
MANLPSSSTDHELASFAAVSALLWNERELLELVLFRLTEEHLLLCAGASRWLAKANDELAAAHSQLSGTEVLRAAEVDALVETLGLPPETTLCELVAVAPEPWATLLAEHRSALQSLVGEIEALRTEVARALSAGASAIRETLDHLSTGAGGYDASGTSISRRSGPILLDEQA